MLDLVAGGIDIVVASHPEGRSLIDAGQVKSRAVLDETRSTLYPTVPTVREAIGSNWITGAWRGMAAPANLPPAIQTRLAAAVQKAYASPEYREFMTTRGFDMRWANAAEFAALMSTTDTQMGTVMKAVGLAK
jgi:tripartite-type tricarboxylate transporter receptor subunit TctC